MVVNGKRSGGLADGEENTQNRSSTKTMGEEGKVTSPHPVTRSTFRLGFQPTPRAPPASERDDQRGARARRARLPALPLALEDHPEHSERGDALGAVLMYRWQKPSAQTAPP